MNTQLKKSNGATLQDWHNQLLIVAEERGLTDYVSSNPDDHIEDYESDDTPEFALEDHASSDCRDNPIA